MRKDKNTKNPKAFTLIELMIAVLAVSILAATSFAAYGNYVKRSRTAEVYHLLSKIADLQYTYYQENGSFIPTGPTNIPPPGPAPVKVDFEANPAENWRAIRFSVLDAIRYGYRCYENTGPTDWICEAQGDLDGDGDVGLFFVSLTASANGEVTKGAIYSFDELE